MSTYRVISWHGIPSQVKATDESGHSVSRLLPPFFQQEIDRVAMAEGLIDSDEYLDGWSSSDPVERDGPAEAVAEAVADEVAQAWRAAHQGPSG
jgi:hypothetical protein